MLFNSYIFVLLFLPAAIIGYFILNHFKFNKTAMLFLLGMSLWFYGYFNYTYLFIMMGSIIVNFLAYKAIYSCQQNSIARKAVTIFTILLNAAALFYFKYYDFFIDNLNTVFKTDFALRNVLLPLGISFFTFQQLSFIIDAYKGEIPKYDFVNYACFVTYFPQLVAGPIVTHDELVPQFSDISKKRFNWDNFTKGLFAFILGLSKKVLIADVLGNLVNTGYTDIKALNSTEAIVIILAYTLQIYFDFSGYSDMAIGMGKMMNIDLPLNFDSPYKAITINDFWKRWHITLTRFFTKYIYIPLGGNRKGEARTYVNIMIVYLVSGIWHGANWTFIFWGVCHGVFCVISRKFDKTVSKIPKCINWLITFMFINIMWVFFRANSMSDAFSLLKQVFDFDFGSIAPGLINSVVTSELGFLAALFSPLGTHKIIILLCYLFVPMFAVVFTKSVYSKMQSLKPNLLSAMMVSCLFVLCILSFSGVSTFLYFNF